MSLVAYTVEALFVALFWYTVEALLEATCYVCRDV